MNERATKSEPWGRPVRLGALVLAVVGVGSALLRYAVSPEQHVAITRPLFGAYATEQLAVLAQHPLAEASHRLGGALYLVLGVLQFLPGLRARRPRLHRWTGRAFLLLSLLVAASGAYMALAFPFEPGERAPSWLFAGLMIFCAGRALLHIVRGEVSAHREWMTRSFAAGLGIGTIRVIAVTLSLSTTLPTRSFYVPAFWAGWVSTMLAGELWVRAQRRAASAPSFLAPTTAAGASLGP